MRFAVPLDHLADFFRLLGGQGLIRALEHQEHIGAIGQQLCIFVVHLFFKAGCHLQLVGGIGETQLDNRRFTAHLADFLGERGKLLHTLCGIRQQGDALLKIFRTDFLELAPHIDARF